MNPPQDLFLFAKAIVADAMLNWLSGDRSISGRRLEIRQGLPWLPMRWTGLGAAASCFIIGSEHDFKVSVVAFAGALTLLIGTARKKATVAITVPPISVGANLPS